MKKLTKLSVQWFYDLLERGECDIMDFKEQLEDKQLFGKSLKSFSSSYDEFGEITNSEARTYLNLPDSKREYMSRLMYELVKDGQIMVKANSGKKHRTYVRRKKEVADNK